MESFELGKGVSLKFATPSDYMHWFGYYNYCPINSTGKKLLVHRWKETEERYFNPNDTIEVGWFDLKDSSWHFIAVTDACNWQQGAMSQWLFLDGEERVIFNAGDGEKYISKIYNTDGTLYKTLPIAIYGINRKELFSITINFERAHWCRAYHYESIANEDLKGNVTEADGVYRLDIVTGEYKKIIGIQDIINLDYKEEFAGCKHWVEHIMLNPSGTRFAFYHRYSNGEGFRTRCITADVDGKNLYIIKGWESNSWSHLGWKNDEEFVLFGIARRAIGKAYSAVTLNSGRIGLFMRKVYRALFARFVSQQIHNKVADNSCYQLYKDREGRTGSYNKGLLINDGHPSFTHDERFMLTDTYGDTEDYRHLLLYDIPNDKLYELGKFYSPINNKGYRSDLHPRFAYNESSVVIDSAHSGKHQNYVFEIDWSYFK